MKDNKVFIIAEAGVNHNGNLRLAKKMIDVASQAKVDAIKFQLFVPELLASPTLSLSSYQKKNLGKNYSQLKMLKELALKPNDFLNLVQHGKRKKILVLASAFDQESLKTLVESKPPLIKVDSGAITDHPLLKKIAATKIPVILSTGASAMNEIKEALKVIEKFHKKIILLHCTSLYPAPYHRINLNAMRTMAKECGYPVGYSDHSLGVEVSVAAVALGAKVIEKHFTLSRKMHGPDHAASIEPDELTEWAQSIRHVESALGSFEKKPCVEEIEVMKDGRRSIVAIKNLKKGDSLSEESIGIRRPGTGLHPKFYKRTLGKILSRDIRIGQPLTGDYIRGYHG